MKNRMLERTFPYGFPLMLNFVLMMFKVNKIEISRFDIVMPSIISISATTIGFLITIIAILIGLLDQRIMTIIKKNDGIKLLKEYIASPLILGFATILKTYYLVIIIDSNHIISGASFYIMLFLINSYTLSLMRIGIILFRIFGQVTDDTINSSKGLVKLSDEKYF